MRPLRIFAAAALCAGSVLLGTGAGAATIVTLSDVSSNTTPASVLDATFEYVVSGNPKTLTLTVTNDTTAPDEFNINQVFFNASTDVTGLSVIDVIHSVEGDISSLWTLEADAGELGPTHADGFGVFTFALFDGMGENDPSAIGPGEWVAFSFDITGAKGINASDFAGVLSMEPPGDTAAFAAAKFVNGPGGDSAFGAAIPAPEPGTSALLLVFGSGAALWLRRRAS